jgi:hypothetical protein
MSIIRVKIPILPVGSGVMDEIQAISIDRRSIVTAEKPRHIIKQRPTLRL